tara:strand:+ start:53 stop:436 length:384 start_codon:yes stop_codon:yes gene_type:complete
MPKLKKYEIEAVGREIEKKILEANPVKEGDVQKEFREKYRDNLLEYLKTDKTIRTLQEKARDLEDNLNLKYSYGTPTHAKLKEQILENIRKAKSPKINKQEIEDLIVINSNLELSEIIEIVLKQVKC